MSIVNFERAIAKQILRSSPTRGISASSRTAVQPSGKSFMGFQVAQQSKNGLLLKEANNLTKQAFNENKKMFSTYGLRNIAKESITGQRSIVTQTVFKPANAQKTEMMAQESRMFSTAKSFQVGQQSSVNMALIGQAESAAQNSFTSSFASPPQIQNMFVNSSRLVSNTGRPQMSRGFATQASQNAIASQAGGSGGAGGNNEGAFGWAAKIAGVAIAMTAMTSGVALCQSNEDAKPDEGKEAAVPVAPVEKKADKPKEAFGLLDNVVCAGGSAVITVSFIHPIDVVKTRLQIAGEAGRATKAYGGVGQAVRMILKDEGMAAFYKGINAAWMREASYTSLRLGLYEPLKDVIGAEGKDASFLKKFLAGALSGGIGSLAGNPFDVMKTRMMANEGAAKGIMHYGSEVYKSSGLAGFYKGIEANIARAAILNATKMACYDQCKETVQKMGVKDGIPLQFMSAFTAGFFMTCTVAPFDIIRTRLMNQPVDQKLYNGFFDCAMKIGRNEGVKGFYKGFIPIWSRFAPTTCLQLIIFEQLRTAWKAQKQM